MAHQKTIVFGLDGACFELIDDWLADGRLPTLAGLLDRGVSTSLDSTVPATTPPAWTSLTTGVNPGRHGVFGFYSRSPSTYQLSPVSDEIVHARRLWDYTTEADQSALVVNVPVTHPPREIDGVLVPGYVAPNRPETHPESILENVDLPEYSVYAPDESGDVTDEELCRQWLDLTDSRGRLARRLLDCKPWDLLFLQFQKTDAAVHEFEDQERIAKIYERVDHWLAELLSDVSGDPNVFVVSDHGIGQSKEWSVSLNTWLTEEGYAETTTRNNTQPNWREREQPTDESGAGVFCRLLAQLSRVGVTKQQIKRVLATVGLYETAVRVLPQGMGDSLPSEDVDREQSRAFYEGLGFSGVDTGVVLNDEQYYDDGTVGSEYPDLREELIEKLSALTGPDGQRAFESVRRREEVYDGQLTREAPDIVLEQAEQYVIGSQYPRGEVFAPTTPGRVDHTRAGLLIAAGPDITEDWSPTTTPSVLDVTPTLCWLHGIPLNDRFDGDPLTDLSTHSEKPTTGSYDPYEPPSPSTVDSAERAALDERLRAMGYVE